MYFRLLGFSQTGTVRTFLFHRIGPLGTVPVAFRLLADTLLAREVELPLQELPTLCTRLLLATSEVVPAKTRTITVSEISAYSAEVLLKKAEAEAARKNRSTSSSQAEQTFTRLTLGRAEASVETQAQLKLRFTTAFKQYSVQMTEFLRLRASLPDPHASADTQALDEQWRAQYEAESEYRSVRMEYAQRLLALARSRSTATS